MAQAQTQQTQVVQSIIQHWANFYGVPDWIALSIAQVESGLNPTATGDVTNGKPTSFGLFQLHTPGGQGDGFAPSQLFDPNLNAQIGIAHMVGPYQQGVAKGLTGYALLEYVAAHSGHPDETGAMPSDYAQKLAQAYQSVTGQSASATTGTTGSSGKVQISRPTGLSGTIQSVFWGMAGIAIVALGIWIMFNPFAELTSSIRTAAGELGAIGHERANVPLRRLATKVQDLPARVRRRVYKEPPRMETAKDLNRTLKEPIPWEVFGP